MPTLRSVNVHPDLCAKLATEVTPPITTPLSLLSRDAAATAQQMNVPLSLWTEVRSGVANAILKQTCTFPSHMPRNNNHEEDNHEHDQLIVGSISALDYWKHSQLLVLPKHDSSMTAILSPWVASSRGICQLTGPPATGKTQLCLEMAVHQTTPTTTPTGKVCYMTSTTPPAALVRRLRQLVAGTQNPKKRLMNIEVVALSTPYELLSALQNVVVEQGSEAEQPTSPLLLIVDSISGCLSGCNDWNLIQQVSLLMKQLVHWHGVQVIVTNGISSSGKAALGQVWNQVAEIQVRVEGVAGGSRAILESHPDPQVCGAVQNFCITLKGVQATDSVVSMSNCSVRQQT